MIVFSKKKEKTFAIARRAKNNFIKKAPNGAFLLLVRY